MDKKIKQVLGVTRLGIVGALIAPLLGWVVSGLNSFKHYLNHETTQVIVWVVVGLLVGYVIQVVLGMAGKRDDGRDDDNKRE